MKAVILGHEVRAIREALGLPVVQFATVLGVHPSSVHRWEGAGAQAVPIEGVALTVISALRQRVLQGRRADRVRAAKTGQQVSDQLALGGVLLALTVLLAFA